MQKILPSLVALVVELFAVVVLASPASADSGDGCNVRDPSCTVGVSGGGGSGSGGGDGGGGSNVDPCADYPNAAYGDKPPTVSQACADELQGNYCNAIMADALGGLEVGSLTDLSIEQIDALNRGLVIDGCPQVQTPATLAEQAYNSITFPKPTGDRSPSPSELYGGYPFTYVDLWTFYWTSPDTWRPLTASASADGFTATVTAQPVELIYDPGDGGRAVSCAGPGRPWTDADGNAAPAGGACGYQYGAVTPTPITSTQSILWKITWTGTDNTGGEIPQLTTSTSGQLNVMQIQTVVTR